ncbi:MAG: phosphoribosylaminoimidazolesuccinocarboxamide synthase [Planctomycetota bacterium]
MPTPPKKPSPDNALPALMRTDLPLPGKRSGKVRDLYRCRTTDGREALALIATDRLSAFDVVMPNAPAGKGVVLTATSAYWFGLIREHFGDRLDTHVLSFDAGDIAGLSDAQRATVRGRVTLGKPTRVVPIECVARGYLAGSGWKEYRESGTVCGIELPKGLQESSELPEPIFTPATKAESGHDENISFEQACDVVGTELMETLRELTLDVYRMARETALPKGLILADTKFEFGLPMDDEGEVVGGVEGRPILIDEVLTPDSSRYWPADRYAPGRSQESFDKQFVRDYLQGLTDRGEWDKTPPGPLLPGEVLAQTSARYLEAYRMLTGRELDLDHPVF